MTRGGTTRVARDIARRWPNTNTRMDGDTIVAAGPDLAEITTWVTGNAEHLAVTHIETVGATLRIDRAHRAWAPRITATLVATIPDPAAPTSAESPFWAVYADGSIVAHNGARPLAQPSQRDIAVNAPIDGAAYHSGGLLLMASSDGRTFRAQPITGSPP